jgi:ribosomal protein S2
MILRRYPKKIKKKRLEEFQKINPNRDGKMRFYTFHIRKNIPPKILFVSSTPQYADIVEEAALRCQMPWQTEQWLNGSITAAVSTLKSKKKWNFYFVSEQLKIEKNFRNTYGKNKEDIEYTEEKKKVYGRSHWPNLILIPDVKNNRKILEETKEVGIPVLGLVSSDCQLNIDYPILAQDMSIHIVHFFCHFMATLIAKEMVKIQHKLFIKTKSGLFRKDRNFFDKKISSRFWYFKRELNYKHNAKKKPRIFVLQEKFINSKRRIKYLVKEELFLPWIDRIAGLSKTDTEDSVEFAYFYSLFYIWSRLKTKSQWNNLNIFTKNIFLREKKYLFFLFEIFKNSYTSFLYGTYIFNLARTAPIIINNEWAKRKKLLNKNIYWTNREQKRALIKAKKNPNSFENILTYQWYGKEGRLRYNNANKMYYWIPLWLLVQRYDIKRFSKQFKRFRKVIRYINIKKKWAYQKYKKAWHGAIKKKIFKKVRKKQVLYYFLKKLASKNCSIKNSYIPKSTNSKSSNKLIYAKDLNYVKKKKKKKNKKI